ncbi:MAG: hypothetical protein IJW38_02140 [Clostridia bacterium]|nr:hypothetical protein [Clostridia bacterium]
MKKKRKNGNYKIKFPTENNAKKSCGNKFLIAFVCIFVSIVVVIGVAVGIISGVRDAKNIAKYKSAGLTEAEAAFFMSYCKYDLLANLKAGSDTEEFWNSKTSDGTKYSEILEYNTKQYIKQVVVANYLFDKYSSLTSSEKEDIKAAVDDVLVYRMENSEGMFNEEAKKHGFSYSDYHGIVTKLYKYSKAYSAYYAANSSKISADEKAVSDYYAEYSKFKLIFINTEKDYKLDDKSNRVVENENYVFVDISEEEKQKRAADILELSKAVANYGTDENFQMSHIMFENYLEKYPSTFYGDKNSEGFYFHEDSVYTKWFKSENPEVISAALAMSEDNFKEVKTELGVCYIYKMPINPTEAPYLDTDSDSCFVDFYSNLVVRDFEKTVTELMEEVELCDAYEKINLISHPSLNYLFVPRF